ncbi:hypothetical protein BGZ58_010729 [Dissophora ornata]|nr:hypothetical protein BGZ58_010729 [Dissophora ornata]
MPEIGALFTKHNFTGQICRFLQQRQINFRLSGQDQTSNPLVAALLPAKVYRKIRHQLCKDKVSTKRNVSTEDVDDDSTQDDNATRQYVIDMDLDANQTTCDHSSDHDDNKDLQCQDKPVSSESEQDKPLVDRRRRCRAEVATWAWQLVLTAESDKRQQSQKKIFRPRSV